MLLRPRDTGRRVIVVRRSRLECLVASRTSPRIDRNLRTVLSCDMNHHIRFHLARMVTSLMRTRKDSRTRGLVNLIHVLLEPTLLNKGLRTSWDTTLVV
jgi:hypothetical protein